MHYLAKSIVGSGYAVWTFNPLSYIGYYPYSYPSGVPFLIAELAEMTGLDIAVAILLADFIFGILLCVGAFCLIRQFIGKPELVLLATFFVVTGPRFVDTTYWDASARGPLIVMMTLTLFAALRAGQAGQKNLLLLASVFGFACFTVHHLAVVLPLVGLAYLIAFVSGQYVPSRTRINSRRVAVVVYILSAISITLVSYGYFEYSGQQAVLNLSSGSLFHFNPPALSIILNMGVSYTNQIGFVIIPGMLGIVTSLRTLRLSFGSLFPACIIISFVPLLGDNLYISMVLLPFFSILGVVWISRRRLDGWKRAGVLALVTILVIASLLLPAWSTVRWNQKQQLTGDTVEVPNEVFNDANYMATSYGNPSAMCNAYVIQSQLSALTGTRFLVSGIPLVIDGDIDASDISGNVTLSKAPFPRNFFDLFGSSNDMTVDLYVLYSMGSGMNFLNGPGNLNENVREFLSPHDNMVVVLDNHWAGSYVWGYGKYSAKLPVELVDAAWHPDNAAPGVMNDLSSYVVYESQRTTVLCVKLGLNAA